MNRYRCAPLCGADPHDPNLRPDVTDHPMVVDALAELADIYAEKKQSVCFTKSPQQVDQLAVRQEMPALETSSWPSIRRKRRETAGVLCETSREPILIPAFLAGHLRAGDQ